MTFSRLLVCSIFLIFFSIFCLNSEAAVSRVSTFNQVGALTDHPLKRRPCPDCIPTGECCWLIFCCQETGDNKEGVTPLNHFDAEN
ncbi:hypothetical protein ACET3Z_018447 [Daucus carota]